MSNHFLHGSVKEIYQTVVNEIPSVWSQVIPPSTEKLLGYGSHGDPDHYSLVPLKSAEGTKLLFSRCSRKHGAMSPSYYVHKQLLDVDVEVLYRNFDLLLETPFCSEEEFDRVANDPARRMQPDTHWSGHEVKINPQILYGVLRAMVCRWRNGSDPVIVRVPEMTAEAYNAYTFGAVRAIYSCLPAGLRGKIGFMTYSSPVKQLNSVGLFFLPENQTGKGVYLDQDENENSRQLMNGYLDDRMDQMIRNVAFDPDHRRECLEDLWELVESGMTLDQIEESDYISCLKYARLLELKMENPQQRKEIQELFDNPGNIPEPLGSKLLEKLSSRITPDELDDHILNRREDDCTFAKYLNRIREWERLCTARAELQEHTHLRVKAVFGEYLSAINEAEQMTEMEAQLSELAQKPTTCFPETIIADCFDDWSECAGPIYSAKLDRTLDAIKGQLDKLICEKAPENMELKKILDNDPKDVNGKFINLLRDLKKEKGKLPEWFSERNVKLLGEYDTRFKELAGEKAGALADRYLHIAEQDLSTVLERMEKGLQEQIDALRTDLKKLLDELLSYVTFSSRDMLEAFDRAAAEGKKNRAQRLVEKANADLEGLSPDCKIDERYDEVLKLQDNLKKDLENLNLENAAEQSRAFCERADTDFHAFLTSECQIKEKNLDDEAKCEAEKKRLKALHKFLCDRYKKDADLKKIVDNLLKKVDPPKRKKKTKESSPSKKKGYRSNSPDRKPKEEPEQVIPDSSHTEPREPGTADVTEKAPVIVEVQGKSLEQIRKELSDTDRSAESITLTDSKTAQSLQTEHSISELIKVLDWLVAPNGKFVPECASVSMIENLVDHFSAAALTPQEKVCVLTALTKDEKFCLFGKSWVEQQIGSPQSWRGDKNSKSEIQRVLRNNPEYAVAYPIWLRKPGLLGLIAFWKENRNTVEGQADTVEGQADTVEGQADTVEDQADTVEDQADAVKDQTGNGWDDEALKRKQGRAFGLGVCAGSAVTAILCVTFWLCVLRPTYEITPPETTVPPFTQSQEASPEEDNNPADGLDEDGTPADGSDADDIPADGSDEDGTPADDSDEDGTPADDSGEDGTPADGSDTDDTPNAGSDADDIPADGAGVDEAPDDDGSGFDRPATGVG